MSKIEELEKIKKLKDNHILTQEEFEVEKDKILNDSEDTNHEAFEKKEKSQKKSSKMIWIVLLIIIVIPIGIIAVPNIMINKDINEMERKLSEIDAEELQNKIIEELKETPLNAHYSDDSLLVVTEFLDTLEETDNFVTAIAVFNIEDDFYVTDIPCFKIKSDSEGKFQTIEYISGSDWFCKDIIQEVIRNVFQESYNIDMHLVGENREKYCSRFLGKEHEPKVNGKSMEIMYDYDLCAVALMTNIIGNTMSSSSDDFIDTQASKGLYKEATTVIWGRLDS